jgi:hypothetical protein
MRVTYFDSLGRFAGSADGFDSAEMQEGVPEGGVMVEGYFEHDTYYDGTAPVKIPTSPGELYTFNWTTRQWEPSAAYAWDVIRSKRDAKLQESDWTQLPDVPITTKELWAVYRQALRDVTLQTDPFNIIWPTPPQA